MCSISSNLAMSQEQDKPLQGASKEDDGGW
jgi:hypothetical protein